MSILDKLVTQVKAEAFDEGYRAARAAMHFPMGDDEEVPNPYPVVVEELRGPQGWTGPMGLPGPLGKDAG